MNNQTWWKVSSTGTLDRCDEIELDQIQADQDYIMLIEPDFPNEAPGSNLYHGNGDQMINRLAELYLNKSEQDPAKIIERAILARLVIKK